MHDDHSLAASGARVAVLSAMGHGLDALLGERGLGVALTLLGATAWEIAKPALRALGDHLLARWRHRRARTLTPPPPPPPPVTPSTPDPET